MNRQKIDSIESQGQIWLFWLLFVNFLKRSDNFSLFLVYGFFGILIPSSRDGFHLIFQKVLFKVGKVLISHNY